MLTFIDLKYVFNNSPGSKFYLFNILKIIKIIITKNLICLYDMKMR